MNFVFTGAQIPTERRMMDNIRDMFDLRDVYHDVVNYGESNQERFTHRWLSFIGFFTGKPPPPLASPSLKSGSRKDEFARLVDGGKGGDVEMSHVPGIHAAGMDGRHMYGDRSGGGSRFADAGRRRERRNSDGEGGDGSSPKLGMGNGTGATSPRAGTPAGGVPRGERLFTLGGSSDEDEGVAMAPVGRESARFSKYRS